MVKNTIFLGLTLMHAHKMPSVLYVTLEAMLLSIYCYGGLLIKLPEELLSMS